MKSRHITGHAVDIAPVIDGQPSWSWPLYYKLAPQVKAAAKAVGVPIEWGGDWKSFKDGPHWQLPWSYDTSKATMPLESPRKPADEPNEVLRRGSSGERVKALQGALREQGYTIDVDGDFGERTAYVVSNFQKSNHLVADSIVGPKTLKLLGL
jgi:N-acetyl-anhydromuramyl-L-alanine amidase AmpD